MAATLVPCTKGKWKKVASAVMSGNVYISKPDPFVFYFTYRAAGDAAPSDEKPFENDGQVRLVWPGLPICSKSPIDVYVYTAELEGVVRVDT